MEGGFGGAAGFTKGAGEVVAAVVVAAVVPLFASAGFTAAAGEVADAVFASVVAVVVLTAAAFVSAGLLVVAGVVAGVFVAASLVSIGGADFFPRPNIGDQAKPIRGAKFKLLSMLF